MFRSIYEVKIEGKDIRRFIQKLYRCNIYFEDIVKEKVGGIIFNVLLVAVLAIW